MEQNRNDRNDANQQRTDPNRGQAQAARSAGREDVMRDLEASETDGKGTGGVGADAGGWTPLPEDDLGA